MGIDMFWTRKKHVWSSPEMQKLGRLEAEVESLVLKWTLYRDEIKKLVNRLEKREERLAAKERAAAAEVLEEISVDVEEPLDAITARVLARRTGNAVPRSSTR